MCHNIARLRSAGRGSLMTAYFINRRSATGRTDAEGRRPLRRRCFIFFFFLFFFFTFFPA